MGLGITTFRLKSVIKVIKCNVKEMFSRLHLKLATVFVDLTDSGRLFQSFGPAIGAYQQKKSSVSELGSCPWNNDV